MRKRRTDLYCVALIRAPPIPHLTPTSGGVNLGSFKLSIIIKLFHEIRGWLC